MEQLKEMLKEVLQEELSTRLDRLDNRMTSFEGQMSSMKEQLDRIERTQTDVVAMLQLLDKKMTTRLDQHEHKISVLNKRLLAVEADVHKLLSTCE